jgi:bacterioferritin (cytochrome b1)
MSMLLLLFLVQTIIQLQAAPALPTSSSTSAGFVNPSCLQTDLAWEIQADDEMKKCSCFAAGSVLLLL